MELIETEGMLRICAGTKRCEECTSHYGCELFEEQIGLKPWQHPDYVIYFKKAVDRGERECW